MKRNLVLAVVIALFALVLFSACAKKFSLPGEIVFTNATGEDLSQLDFSIVSEDFNDENQDISLPNGGTYVFAKSMIKKAGNFDFYFGNDENSYFVEDLDVKNVSAVVIGPEHKYVEEAAEATEATE